jgi:pimeloyl-ACP methyl ester carboxylesterase
MSTARRLCPTVPKCESGPPSCSFMADPGSFDHTYFKPDFARLSTAVQVVYLDLPGHGRSEWGEPARWSFEQSADSVRDFCDTLGIARPVVYGHSLGGFVAMLYAARHPGHAGALVLQSTFARFNLGRIVGGVC